MWISQLINNPMVMWNQGGAGAEGGGGVPVQNQEVNRRCFVHVCGFSL